MKRDSSFLNDALDSMPLRKEEHADNEVDSLDIVMATLHESDQIFTEDITQDNEAKESDIWLSQIDEGHQESAIDAQHHLENTDHSFENTELDDYWTII
jgi:hypothetical protein